MNSERLKERVYYLDVIRVFALFCVVIIHVSATFWAPFKTEIDSAEWKICNFFDGFAHIGVPLFVMLSGAVTLGRGYTIKKCLSKILHYCFVLLVFSSIYTAVKYLKSGSFPGKARIIHDILTGDSAAHLWYLYMLLGLYVVIPFLDAILEKGKLPELFIVLFVLFALLVPFAGTVLSSLSFKYAGALKTTIERIISKMRFFFPLGYTGLSLIGHRLRYRELSLYKRVLIYFLGAASLLAIVAGTKYISMQSGTRNLVLYDNLSLPIVFLSVSVFVFIRSVVEKSETIGLFFHKIAVNSFGIYLIHLLFIWILEEYRQEIYSNFPNMIPLIVIASVLVCLICFCIVSVLKKVPVFKSFLS